MLTSWRLLGACCLLQASHLGAQCADGSPPPCDVRRSQPLVIPELRRLTTSGRAASARVSADGRLLAYVEDNVLYVKSIVAGGAPTEVSRDRWAFTTSFRWFPDGNRLLTRGDSGLFVMSSLGGTPRLIDRHPPQYVSMSQDGRFLLLSEPVRAWILTVATGSSRVLTISGNDTFYTEHAWSPDGAGFVIVSTDGKSRYRLQTVSATTGAARVLLQDSVPLSSLNWDAASSSIVYMRAASTGAQVWRQPVSPSGRATGEPRLVLPHIEATQFQVIDGKHLAYRLVERVTNFFIRGVGDDTTSRRLTGDATNKNPLGVFSADGRSVAFLMVDEAGENLHVSRVDSGAPVQLTRLRDRTIRSVAWSPDGKRIAYCSNGDRGIGVSVVAVAGGPTIALPVRDVSADCTVEWISPDALLYALSGNHNYAVHPLTGVAETRLVSTDSAGWMFNPVADLIHDRVAVMWNRIDQGPSTWLIGLNGGAPQQLTPRIAAFPLRFSPDGSTLYGVTARRDKMIRLRMGDSVAVDTLRIPTGCSVVDMSPDGSRALCWVTESVRRDIWLLRNFDPAAPKRP